MRKNIDAFSYLRVFATFGVIVLHVAYSSYLLFRDGLSVQMTSALLGLTNALRFCVPCFVAVTGALLLNPEKKISVKKIWTKYILRVFVALLAFSALFFVFDLIMDSEKLTLQYALNALKELYTAKGWAHLWYLYLLLFLYAILPFLKMITEKATDKEFKYLLTLYFAFVCVLPLTRFFGLKPGYFDYIGSVYPFYMLLGYAIYHGKIKIKAPYALCLFAVSEAAVVILNIVSNVKGIENLSYFWNYQSPLTVISAACCFSLFCGIKNSEKEGLLKKCVMSVDGCTLGIYLLHMLFVRLVLRYMQFNPLNYAGVLGLLGFSVALFAVTYLIVRLLKFIPGVKKIL